MSMARVAASLPVAALIAVCPFGVSRADDSPGWYLGGSIAQAQLETTWTIPPLPISQVQGPYNAAFNETATGFKFFAGVRPLSFLGAEISYEDLGRAQGGYNPSLQSLLGPASVGMRGESAFGVLYLPAAPLDVFAKAGIAVLRSSVTTNTAVPGFCGLCAMAGPPSDLVRTSSDLAVGAGAQVSLGHFVVRGEYERFTAAGAHPALLSLGLIWRL